MTVGAYICMNGHLADQQTQVGVRYYFPVFVSNHVFNFYKYTIIGMKREWCEALPQTRQHL